MKVKLTLAFDGTAYHGWQVQQNAITVQETLQNAAEKVFGVRPGISGCSRTDSGVHALMYCCHLDIDTAIPAASLPRALNMHLPRDIVVFDAQEVLPEFHARYSCTRKTYLYKIHNAPYRDPFSEGYTLFVHRPLNVESMNRTARDFLGAHDFSAFCSQKSKIEDKHRTVFKALVKREGNTVSFEVTADGFLYNMVRIMIGTLLTLEHKKAPEGTLTSIIESKDRKKAGKTAPPQGLYLAKVEYER